MSKYLTTKIKNELKRRFTLTKSGWFYKPYGNSKPIPLTYEDICNIHDFLVFQSTQEYRDWVIHQEVEDIE